LEKDKGGAYGEPNSLICY